MGNFREHRGMEIEGLDVLICSDLSPITLRRRRTLKFLTNRLTKCSIRYRWGFSFKLVIDYKSRQIIIRSEEEAHKFLLDLDGQIIEDQGKPEY